MSTDTVLTDKQILDPLKPLGIKGFRETALSAGRAIGQAVLQSPEVQAWKKDAERYRFMRSVENGAVLEAAIDAAMEKQP